MTLVGALFMILSWSLIISLAAFCFYRIFSKKEVD